MFYNILVGHIFEVNHDLLIRLVTIFAEMVGRLGLLLNRLFRRFLLDILLAQSQAKH